LHLSTTAAAATAAATRLVLKLLDLSASPPRRSYKSLLSKWILVI